MMSRCWWCPYTSFPVLQSNLLLWFLHAMLHSAHSLNDVQCGHFLFQLCHYTILCKMCRLLNVQTHPRSQSFSNFKSQNITNNGKTCNRHVPHFTIRQVRGW